MKNRVYISWEDQPPIEYGFDTLDELNAFLQGVEEAGDRGNLQFEQFDTLADWKNKYVVEED